MYHLEEIAKKLAETPSGPDQPLQVLPIMDLTKIILSPQGRQNGGLLRESWDIMAQYAMDANCNCVYNPLTNGQLIDTKTLIDSLDDKLDSNGDRYG